MKYTSSKQCFLIDGKRTYSEPWCILGMAWDVQTNEWWVLAVLATDTRKSFAGRARNFTDTQCYHETTPFNPMTLTNLPIIPWGIIKDCIRARDVVGD